MNSCSRAPTFVNFSVTVSPGRTVIVRGEKVNSFIVISITRPAAGLAGCPAHAAAATTTRRRATLRSASDERDMGEASLFGGIGPRAERHSPVVQRPSLIAGVVREIERPSRLVFAIQALD